MTRAVSTYKTFTPLYVLNRISTFGSSEYFGPITKSMQWRHDKISRKSEHVFDKTKRLFCALHYLIRPRWSVTAPAPGLRHLRDITFRCCLLICRQIPGSARRILAGWARGGWALLFAACVRWRWLHRWRCSRPSSRRKAATVRCIKWAERRPATRRTWMSWLISKVPVETLAEFYVLCL